MSTKSKSIKVGIISLISIFLIYFGMNFLKGINVLNNGKILHAYYEDVAGFCYKAKFDEIEKNSFVLTPGRYVGAAEEEDDGEPFEEKMKRLTSLLRMQQEEGLKLDQQISENLKRITNV